MTFILGTHNVKDNPDLSMAKVRSAGEVTSGLVHSVGFQEIDQRKSDNDLTVLKESMPDETWWWNDANGTEVPQAFRKDHFIPTEDRFLPANTHAFETRLLHPGKKGVNPNRYVTRSFVNRTGPKGRPLPGLNPVAKINTHWVNGVFSEPGQQDEEWRQSVFPLGWEGVRDLVMETLEFGIYTIFITGDFNARYFPTFTKNQEWAWGPTIDKVGVIRAPRGNVVTFVPNSAKITNTTSDHHLKTVEVDMQGPIQA